MLEIDLIEPMIRKVGLRGHCYHIEYEKLHLCAVLCGYYGHLKRDYSKTTMTTVVSGVDITTKTGREMGATTGIAIDVNGGGQVGNSTNNGGGQVGHFTSNEPKSNADSF